MGIIYITRHGETELNLQDRFQGSLDSPLTEKGIKQAEALRDRLSTVKIDKIYSSPLGRAYKTASIINEGKGVPIITDEGLNEHDFGDWEGMLHDDLCKLYNVTKEWVFTHPLEYQPVHGERFEAFTDRIVKTLDKIAAANEDSTILIVAHAVSIKTMFAYIRGLDVNGADNDNDMLIPQASLSAVEYNNSNFTILFDKDIEHLRNI